MPFVIIVSKRDGTRVGHLGAPQHGIVPGADPTNQGAMAFQQKAEIVRPGYAHKYETRDEAEDVAKRFRPLANSKDLALSVIETTG